MFGAARSDGHGAQAWAVDPQLLRLFALLGLFGAAGGAAVMAVAVTLWPAALPANAVPMMMLSFLYSLVFLGTLASRMQIGNVWAARVMIWGAWASSIVYGLWITAHGYPTLWVFLLIPMLLAATFAMPRDVVVMGASHAIFLFVASGLAGVPVRELAEVHVANVMVAAALALNAAARVKAVHRHRVAKHSEAAARRDVSRVLDAVDEAIIVYDPAQRILVHNDPAKRLYREAFAIDITGSPVLPHGTTRNAAAYRQLLNADDNEEHVMDVRDTNGRDRSFVAVNLSWGGADHHRMLMVRDRRSEQLRQTEATHRARVESLEMLLEKTAEQRARFVAAAAHLIGSPIKAISLQLDILDAHAVSPDMKRAVLILRRNVERIEEALRNLDEEEASDAWAAGKSAQPTIVAEIAQRRLAAYQGILDSKGVKAEVTGDLTTAWQQDPDLVEAAMDSLLYAAASDINGQEALKVIVQQDEHRVVVERHFIGRGSTVPDIPPKVDVERGVRIANRVAAACGGTVEMQPRPRELMVMRRFILTLPEHTASRLGQPSELAYREAKVQQGLRDQLTQDH